MKNAILGFILLFVLIGTSSCFIIKEQKTGHRCMGVNIKGKQCTRDGVSFKYGYYCWQHEDQRFKGSWLRTSEHKRHQKY